ncbi:MAG TPA: hypothetical protein VH092_20920 [Urbifossiella sp.]|jgi:hypothetical protein|nr:hypothetical protein [Urbifossiella sp.]
MEILLPPVAACNAVSPSVVRPVPTPVVVQARKPDEFITGPFTEEKFEQWLNSHRSRQLSHVGDSPKERERTRKRMARLWVLRETRIVRDLLAAVKLADALQEALEGITSLYGPQEARRVLLANELAFPRKHDVCQSGGGDHFAESHRLSRGLIRELEDYREVVWGCIELLIPDHERPAEDDTDDAAEVAAEGGAA